MSFAKTKGKLASAAPWLVTVLLAGPSCTPTATEPLPATEAAAATSPESRVWTFGHTPLRFSLTSEPLAWAFRVRAASEEAAHRMAEPAVKQGAGTALSADVTVDLLLTADLTGGFFCLHSSTTGEFDNLTLALGEDTLADLASGTNAEVTHPGSGWTTVTIRLASMRVPPGTSVVLSQHRAGEPPDRVTRFAVGF